MLAIVALAGAGVLSGFVDRYVSNQNGTDSQRRVFDNRNATSDDPMHYEMGQPNPRQYRNTTIENIRDRDHTGLFSAPPDVLARQTGVTRGPMRTLDLDPGAAKRLDEFRWSAYNSDLPFTGRNGSIDNYRLRFERSFPLDPNPGMAIFQGPVGSLDETVGTRPQVSSLLGPGLEDKLIIDHGGQNFATGRVFTVDGRPVFSHLF